MRNRVKVLTGKSFKAAFRIVKGFLGNCALAFGINSRPPKRLVMCAEPKREKHEAGECGGGVAGWKAFLRFIEGEFVGVSADLVDCAVLYARPRGRS